MGQDKGLRQAVGGEDLGWRFADWEVIWLNLLGEVMERMLEIQVLCYTGLP